MASKTFSMEAGTSRSKVKVLCSVIVALSFPRLEHHFRKAIALARNAMEREFFGRRIRSCELP